MASSMIPPRVSSSPPPLDTHPSDSYLGLTEDEFDEIAPHNASFDITGLSDKLPPTPGGSPVKSPVLPDTNISMGTMSPPPSINILSKRELEEIDGISSINPANGDLEGIVNGVPDVDQLASEFDEYGDFEDFQGFNPPLDQLDYSGDNVLVDKELTKEMPSETSGDSEISQSCKQEENPVLDSTLEKCSLENVPAGDSHSIKSEKKDSCETTVPSIRVENDQISSDRMSKCAQLQNGTSDTRRSSGVEEREQDISCSDYSSATSSPLKDYDKDWKTERVGSKQVVRQSESKSQQGGEAEAKQEQKNLGVKACQKDESRGDVREESGEFNERSGVYKICDETRCDVLPEKPSGDSESNCKIKEVDISIKDVDKCEFSGNSVNIADGKPEQILPNAVDVEGKSPGESSFSAVHEDVSGNDLSKLDSNKDRDSRKEMNVEFDSVDDEFGQFVESTSIGNKKNEFDNTIVETDDFGNFHQLTSDISVDNDFNNFPKLHEKTKEVCEEFGDFVEPSHQNDEFGQFTAESVVEMDNCSQLNNPSVENDGFADFGNFSSGFGDEFSKYTDASEDDFGDFDEAMDILKQKAVQEVVEEEDDEYQVFQFSTKPSLSTGVDEEDDDDFGTFVTPETVVPDENVDVRTMSEGEDDNFGSFSAGDTISKERTQRGKERKLSERDSAIIGDGCSDSGYGGFGDFSSTESTNMPNQTECGALSKLEMLVRKWIVGQTLSQQHKEKVPSLKFAVESDALLWRKLADLDSSQALHLSWGSLQAHKLFLSSINIDARNIVSKEAMMTLFGQKWSSSVPLFARTLSFSPLTPAKPSESAGDASQVGPTNCLHKLQHSAVSLSTTAVPTPPLNKSGGEEGVQSEPENTVPETEEKMEEMIPPAKFDWSSSGLTNPLEGPAYSSSLLDLDLLLSSTSVGKGPSSTTLTATLERELLSEGSNVRKDGKKPVPATTLKPSPLVQQILSTSASASQVLPLESLLPEVRQVVEGLPDLSYMRSRVLMFPLRGEQQ
ncbi:uncharacterized protein LOC143021075 isoform X2 [Oratosquilla oratoria]|uniref:uncharacterized protein LOC143021075 isoform X2 n=1 Tax=Oratosquilla oratoria TaxID=337810 RepID=UPI003F75B3FA